MDKEKGLPKRKDLRLKQYDYSSAGAYFVTICIKDRKRILSTIIKPTPTNEMLPHIVSTFKRFCNREIGDNIFQRGYIEHIVRDREDYETRSNYIFENPLRWYYDELYAEE
ncbi:MAG: hypothetical protein E7634_02140 [Ruminococcaceae bacterium]|nr:hypothetical protein [Oscillospiraceae bacterium]